MHLILALAIYSFGLLTGALCVAFFEGAGRGRLSDAPQIYPAQPTGGPPTIGSSLSQRHTKGPYSQALTKR
jgi:hypothetical protein